MYAYLEWAQALTPEKRAYIWIGCLLLLTLYIVIDNWEGIFHDKWPEDD